MVEKLLPGRLSSESTVVTDDITEPISSGYRPIPDSKQALADVGLRHIRIGHLPAEQPHPHTRI